MKKEKTNESENLEEDDLPETTDNESEEGDPQIAALEREIAELESKLSAAVSDKEKESGKVRDFNTMYGRLQSDFDNYRKRTAEQLGRAKNDGIAEAIIKMIPVLDVVTQALRMITDEKVAEGVSMINRQVLEAFNAFGVTEIPALGKPFDPELHNAVMQVPAARPEDEGMVMEVLQKGYRMGDRILRHSVVKVAR